MAGNKTVPLIAGNYNLGEIGLKPSIIDKDGPGFIKKDVIESVKKLIKIEDYFKDKAKIMNKDTEKAIELTDEINERFTSSLDGFHKTTCKFSDSAKKASGSVRDAADKLANGLLKIEKAANFDRLERYVELLERAASAMEALAALEKSGKLDKIASAIR